MVRKTYGSLFETGKLMSRCLLREMVNLVIAEINQQNDKQYRDETNYVCNFFICFIVEWVE